MATRLPYYASENDIYTQIMRQMQSRPAALANPYENFTGGYDPSLYNRPRQQGEGLGGMVPGLLDTGGGIGDTSSTGAQSYGNPADAIAIGQALQGYGQALGGFAPGASIAGLLGTGMVNAGINALGAMEAAAAQDAATAYGLSVADAVGMSGFGNAMGGLSAADGVGMSGFGDAMGGLSVADGVGMSGFDGVGNFGGISAAEIAAAADVGNVGGGASDAGGLAGQGASGDTGGYGIGFAKGGKVTMGGLLTDVVPPGEDDGYGALQVGEYVIKKSTAKKLGDKKLKALNEGKASIKMRK